MSFIRDAGQSERQVIDFRVEVLAKERKLDPGCLGKKGRDASCSVESDGVSLFGLAGKQAQLHVVVPWKPVSLFGLVGKNLRVVNLTTPKWISLPNYSDLTGGRPTPMVEASLDFLVGDGLQSAKNLHQAPLAENSETIQYVLPHSIGITLRI